MQVELDSPITAVADVQVDRPARLLRDEFLKVCCAADAQFLEVTWAICVHRIRAYFLSCRNVRAGDYYLLDCCARLPLCCASGCRLLRPCRNNQAEDYCNDCDTDPTTARSRMLHSEAPH